VLLKACTAEAPAEHFATGAARLPSKRIEAGEVVFIDAKGHDAGFGLPRHDPVARFGRHSVRLHWARSSKTASASSRDSACLERDRTLRAKVPRVSAVGESPTSALEALGPKTNIGLALCALCGAQADAVLGLRV
jgi:hypothetical protein